MRRMCYLVILLMFSACTNPVDDSENILKIETIQGKCSDCLEVGSNYRFTSLSLESVAGGEVSLMSALNAAWSNDISKGELSVFMRVESIENNTVTFRLMSGARVGADAKCLVTETQVALSLPLNEDGMGPSDPTDLYVYAGSEDHPKNCNRTGAAHAIPVVNVTANVTCSGVCEPQDQDTLEGVFDAALTKEGLAGTCVCLDLSPSKLSDEVCGDFDAAYVSADGKCDGCGEKYQALEGLIPAFNGGSDLDWASCEESAGGEAACLTASFKAVKMDPAEVPPECP